MLSCGIRCLLDDDVNWQTQPPIKKITEIPLIHHVAELLFIKHEITNSIEPIAYRIIDSVFITLFF